MDNEKNLTLNTSLDWTKEKDASKTEEHNVPSFKHPSLDGIFIKSKIPRPLVWWKVIDTRSHIFILSKVQRLPLLATIPKYAPQISL